MHKNRIYMHVHKTVIALVMIVNRRRDAAADALFGHVSRACVRVSTAQDMV